MVPCVIFEDKHLLVVNKPAGWNTHSPSPHAGQGIYEWLRHREPAWADLAILHRLDKETSGIMVVARTLAAHHHLVAQLQARTVRREYCAVCVGAVTGGGTIDLPIGRHPRQRKKMAVLAAGGKPAITHFRVVRRFGHHTHLAVTLETGRTHQIRVHMAHRHNPLVGDPLYGGRPRIPKGASEALVQALRGFPRQALHARILGLIHPERGEPMQFETPIPGDIAQLLAVLEREDAPEHG